MRHKWCQNIEAQSGDPACVTTYKKELDQPRLNPAYTLEDNRDDNLKM